MMKYLFLLVLCFNYLSAHECCHTIAVSYNGRFIPLEVSLKLQLQELHGKYQIKKNNLSAFEFFLNTYAFGKEPFADLALFSIHYAKVKKALNLNKKESHFSYNQLKNSLSLPNQLEKLKKGAQSYATEASQLIAKLDFYEALKRPKNTDYEDSFYALKEKGVPKKEIALNLELHHPLQRRLFGTGILFKAIPDKQHNWHSIDTLGLKTYDATSDKLQPIGNFTLYADSSYKKIQQDYFSLQAAILTEDQNAIYRAFETLTIAIDTAYQEIERTPSKEAFEKTLFYPSKHQLEVEYIYYHYPFAKVTTILYLIAFLGLIFGKTLKKKSIHYFAFFFLSSAFLLHTLLLAMRTFILNRPPVSNMFETVLYVPWISMIAGYIFYLTQKNSWLLIASCFSSLLLLVLVEFTGMHQQLENVQAVLDSNYWLTVHVLLIVGSYGVFFLCGLLGQIYLTYSFFYPQEKQEMKFLSKFILQTMYAGVFMLIPGTILGGVWAAESWGRFWDWDPKESWAFISSSIYLVFIHAYRFNKISSFGLSFGAVLGLMAITFTWYGVNYILGTGLHSYGFGTGKDIYYYIFLLIQTAFLIIVSIKHQKRLELKSKNLL